MNKYARTGYLLLTIFAGTALAPAQPVIGDVRVENRGDGELDPGSVSAFLNLRPGSYFDRSAVNRAVQALQQTGRFSSVRAEAVALDDQVLLVFGLENRPRIRRIEVAGAEHMGNKRVLDLLELRVGDPVDDTVIGARAAAVQGEYRERLYLEPELTWTILPDEGGDTAEVKIAVKEGPRGRISQVAFRGNHHFGDSELKNVLQHKRYRAWNPWHWVTRAGRVELEPLMLDREAIAYVYRDAGYLDVRVSEPEVGWISDRRLSVSYLIEEGPRYRMGTASITGATVFDEADLAPLAHLPPGEPASFGAIVGAARRIREHYSSRGYIFARVEPRLIPEGDEIDVTFQVEEGHMAHIRDIRIRGNHMTRDKVIRRELAVYPGDLFDESRVRVSEARLRNLEYFSSVHSYPEGTADPSRYDLVFELEEQRMGQMSLGAGFSSIDKVSGFFEISHGNFDLSRWPPVGGGQKLKFRTTLGTERQDVEFSFVEPWFLDRRLSLGLDLFHHERRFLSDDYDQRNTGGTVSLTKPLGRFERMTLAYSLENYDVYNVSPLASNRIREEEGERLKSTVSLTLSRDTRDNFFIPSRGNRTSATASLAGGPFMGDTDIYSLELRSAQHWPVWRSHVFSLRGRIATVDYYGDSDRVPIFDRYFLGGPYNLRGFRFRDVGPVDEDEEPVGGLTEWFGSAEYTVPVVKSIRLAAFYDMGYVLEEAFDIGSSYNSDAGVGVRFDIPMFPLRFDYAWPLETDDHNRRSSPRFSFMIGHVF